MGIFDVLCHFYPRSNKLYLDSEWSFSLFLQHLYWFFDIGSLYISIFHEWMTVTVYHLVQILLNFIQFSNLSFFSDKYYWRLMDKLRHWHFYDPSTDIRFTLIETNILIQYSVHKWLRLTYKVLMKIQYDKLLYDIV